MAILAAVAVTAVTAERAVVLQSTRIKREMETELIFRGLAYRNAIRSYYLARVPHEYPRRLDDLLKDPRFLYRRHLRKLYADPLGGDWRLLRNERGRIIGVASHSTARPLKSGNFIPDLSEFAGTESYADWRFEYLSARQPTNKN